MRQRLEQPWKFSETICLRGGATLKVREPNAAPPRLAPGANRPVTDVSGEVSRAVMEVQARAADQIDALNEQLRKLQAEVTNRTMQIKSDADMRMETARIDADAKVRVAEIQNDNNTAIQGLENNLADLGRKLEEAMAAIKEPKVPEPKAPEENPSLPSP